MMVEEGTVTETNALKVSINWMAIELVVPSGATSSTVSNRLHTTKSDIWALGMVFYVSYHLKQYTPST